MAQTTALARLPQPAPDYSTALERLAALKSLDGADVNPACHSQLLSHGHATDRVIVLIHGMTNCPRQFQRLAPLFFERGYNVLAPRQPRNGLSDVDTRALGGLTLSEQVDNAHQAVDIARGLGRHVTILGISAGGTLVSWLAQFRADVDAAVAIAPLFGILPPLPVFNAGVNFAVMRLLLWAPNVMTQTISPFTEGPPQGYRGFATRGLASAMRLGSQVFRAAAIEAPRARSMLMMLNPVDPAVNNPMSLELLGRWEARGAQARLYQFDPTRKLIHDIVDPEQPQQQCDYVYPILLDKVTAM